MPLDGCADIGGCMEAPFMLFEGLAKHPVFTSCLIVLGLGAAGINAAYQSHVESVNKDRAVQQANFQADVYDKRIRGVGVAAVGTHISFDYKTAEGMKPVVMHKEEGNLSFEYNSRVVGASRIPLFGRLAKEKTKFNRLVDIGSNGLDANDLLIEDIVRDSEGNETKGNQRTFWDLEELKRNQIQTRYDAMIKAADYKLNGNRVDF